MIDWMKFKTTGEEMRLMAKIADRANKLHICIDRMTITMDLEATHAACPLRLEELLAADRGDFFHDVTGINRWLNRETGELTHFFLPRFAK